MPTQAKIAYAFVGGGVIVLAIGVGFIFWPAALIVIGIAMLVIGALAVDIPEEPEVEPGPKR